MNPDGKVIQQPSTHIISPSFAKAFNITYKDKDGKEKPAYTTCYGPAISRIFASVVIVHGDDKGLKFPWEIAPVQVMIVPIDEKNKTIMKKAELLKKQIEIFADVAVDSTEKRAGEKFNYWEMKGVPVRIDLGLNDIKKKKITLFRRDLDKKEIISEKDLMKKINKISKEFTKNLIKKADKVFEGRIKDAKNLSEIKKAVENGLIARCNFCSVNNLGVQCAEKIEKETNAQVRGTKLDEKSRAKGKCVICGKKANEIVYVARAY